MTTEMAPSSMCIKPTLLKLGFWIFIVMLASVVIGPGLKGDFFYDDIPNIVENNAVHIEDLTFTSLVNSLSGPAAGPLGRPVSVLSFAITHYLFGLDPFYFKVINLIIHIFNGFLVACGLSLLLQVFADNKLTANSKLWLPRWLAAVWLLHPINIMPVMLTVQRMTLLASMFLLLALICHLKALSNTKCIRWEWLISGWLIFWPLSILSKETGLLFPFFILAITFFSTENSTSSPKRRWIVGTSIFLIAIICFFFWQYLGSSWLESVYRLRPFSLSERLMTESRTLWFYLAQIVMPDYKNFGIFLDDFTISDNLLAPPTTLLSIMGWGICLAAIVYWRRPHSILCFSLAWFLIGHSLESTVLPLEIAHEYRNYIPSIGPIVGLGYMTAIFLQKAKLDNKALMNALVICIPLTVLSLLTWMRADQLGKPLVGSQIEASRHPLSARANYAAALALFRAGYGDLSDPIGGQSIHYYFQQAGKADSAFKAGHLGLIVWACASNRLVEAQWVDELAYRLEHTHFSPQDRNLPNEIVEALINMPTCITRDAAMRLFLAGTRNPAIANQVQAKFFEAAADYELLVSIDPISARQYLVEAAHVSPHDIALQKKLTKFESLEDALRKH